MNDLTPVFVTASTICHEWSPETIRFVLSSLAKCFPQGTVDWEQGDESWGRVISGGKVVAYVSAYWPLAIVVPLCEKQAREACARIPIEFLVVPSFAEKAFSVDKEALETLYSRPLSGNIDYLQFSIDDLWWATV
jgi:hypothetical protein